MRGWETDAFIAFKSFAAVFYCRNISCDRR